MKFRSPVPVAYLAISSAIIVFSYNVVLNKTTGDKFNTKDGIPELSRGLKVEEPTWFDGLPGEKMDTKRKLNVEAYMEKRIQEVFQETWPICTEQRWTATYCKEYIDEQILTTFTERDRYIRVIIKGKRKKEDTWYNTVVIPMDDRDMAVGRDLDGQIHYDFEWDGSGELATPEEESEIPPVLATETEAGSAAAQDALATDPNSLAPEVATAADPTSDTYEPLILEEEPALVQGGSLGGVVAGTDTNPIGGGVVVDPTAPNDTPEADARLAQAISDAGLSTDPAQLDPAFPSGTAPVDAAGPRTLESVDCTGMTAHNCCLMVKLKVRDRDANGKSIQCQLMYTEGSDKERWWLNSRGKKVFIFANHNELVSKVPEIVGAWPPGQGTDSFSGWLEDGGDPNRTDWIPPEGTR